MTTRAMYTLPPRASVEVNPWHDLSEFRYVTFVYSQSFAGFLNALVGFLSMTWWFSQGLSHLVRGTHGRPVEPK
jgi:hypothetical protein